MAPSYDRLRQLTTQPLALREKGDEEEMRMDQRCTISEKPKGHLFRTENSSSRIIETKRKGSGQIMVQAMSAELCGVWRSIPFACSIVSIMWIQRPPLLQARKSQWGQASVSGTRVQWKPAVHRRRLFCGPLVRQATSQLGAPPFPAGRFVSLGPWVDLKIPQESWPENQF